MTVGLWPGLIGRRHSDRRGISARAAASLRSEQAGLQRMQLFGSGIRNARSRG